MEPIQHVRDTKPEEVPAVLKKSAEAAVTTAPLIPVQTAAINSVPVKPVAIAPAAPEKKASKPWEQMITNRPWQRDMFKLSKKRPGYRPRFVNPDRVEQRIQRGYEVARPEHYGGLLDSDIRDGKNFGNMIVRHGMVLMEIAEEGAQAYEKQQEDFIKSQYRKASDEVKREAAVNGVDISVTEKGLH